MEKIINCTSVGDRLLLPTPVRTRPTVVFIERMYPEVVSSVIDSISSSVCTLPNNPVPNQRIPFYQALYTPRKDSIFARER
jgi:hypothetical protein